MHKHQYRCTWKEPLQWFQMLLLPSKFRAVLSSSNNNNSSRWIMIKELGLKGKVFHFITLRVALDLSRRCLSTHKAHTNKCNNRYSNKVWHLQMIRKRNKIKRLNQRKEIKRLKASLLIKMKNHLATKIS